MTELIRNLADKLVKDSKYMAAAESCTGGLVSKLCTDLPGSSLWFDRGFVSYSNKAKSDMLGVDLSLIEKYGAVSSQTVAAMTLGAIKNSGADYALAISGIAGPGGGISDKPVGTVFFGFLSKGSDVIVKQKLFTGSREKIRQQSAEYAISTLSNLVNRA